MWRMSLRFVLFKLSDINEMTTVYILMANLIQWNWLKIVILWEKDVLPGDALPEEFWHEKSRNSATNSISYRNCSCRIINWQ